MQARRITVERELCPEPATLADIGRRLRNAALVLASIAPSGARHRAKLLGELAAELQHLGAECQRLAQEVTRA